MIHDNGGRPFKVVQGPSKTVKIYKATYENEDDYDEEPAYTKMIKEYSNIEKLFVGKSPLNEMTGFSGGHGPSFDGNSLLLSLPGNRYVFIGQRVYEFTPPEPIEKYYSSVGNSDVPYPVALSKSYAYFMIEGPTYAPRSAFPADTDWSDAYTFFYDGLDKKLRKPMRIKVVQKRDF